MTLQPIRSDAGDRVVLDVQVKMVGMNLVRVRMGSHPSADAADDAWCSFLATLDVER